MATIVFDTKFSGVLEPDEELKAVLSSLIEEFESKIMTAVRDSQKKRQIVGIPSESTRILLRLTLQDSRNEEIEDKI